jgi:hypothetical protein
VINAEPVVGLGDMLVTIHLSVLIALRVITAYLLFSVHFPKAVVNTITDADDVPHRTSLKPAPVASLNLIVAVVS